MRNGSLAPTASPIVRRLRRLSNEARPSVPTRSEFKYYDTFHSPLRSAREVNNTFVERPTGWATRSSMRAEADEVQTPPSKLQSEPSTTKPRHPRHDNCVTTATTMTASTTTTTTTTTATSSSNPPRSPPTPPPPVAPPQTG